MRIPPVDASLAVDLGASKPKPNTPATAWEVKIVQTVSGDRVAVTARHPNGVFYDQLSAESARIVGQGLLQLANLIDPPGLTPKVPIIP